MCELLAMVYEAEIPSLDTQVIAIVEESDSAGMVVIA